MSEKFDTSTKLDVEINKSIPVAGGIGWWQRRCSGNFAWYRSTLWTRAYER